ncbi:MAG TPA: TerB family tellurite resistance protein [Polyangiales bacterium]|nr:TerB family tellurite resistance protein [Polyangiales bacterium]
MSNPQIERLRATLLRRGMLTSRPPPPLADPTWNPEQVELARRVRPFAEAMYLVIAADAEIGTRERDVLRGALRTLTDNQLSTAALETMLQEFESARAEEGTEARLDAVASALYLDPTDAELAVKLAIAGAEVDGRLDAREQAVVRALAERLGFSERQLGELLEGEPYRASADYSRSE